MSKSLYSIALSSFLLSSLIFSSSLFGAGNEPLAPSRDRPATTQASQGNPGGVMGQTYSLAAVQEDYDQLRKCLLYELLPKPFADSNEIMSLLKSQAELLHDGMTELEFFRVMNPIIVKLHCGHTALSLSKEYQAYLRQNGHYLPLAVKVIDEKAYVWHAFGASIPRGSEILAINGRPVCEVIQRLLANITADGSNETFKMARLNHNFSAYYFDFGDTADRFVIDFRDFQSQKPGTVTLTAINGAELAKDIKEFLPLNPAEAAPYSSEIQPKYAHLKITTFAIWDAQELQKAKDYVDTFFQEVAQRKISDLILDLRDNGGGNLAYSGYLYAYLISKATPYFTSNSTLAGSNLKFNSVEPFPNAFKEHLTILINGGSFSATGLLSSLLKYHKIGIFVGEETGGSYIVMNNFSNDKCILANTGLSFSKTEWLAQTVVSGLTPGRGIFPDYEVKPNLEEYLNGRDVQLEFALDLIKQRQAKQP